jgi:lysophospholipase L1-like esterase
LKDFVFQQPARLLFVRLALRPVLRHVTAVALLTAAMASGPARTGAPIGQTPIDGQCLTADLDHGITTVTQRGRVRPETTRGFMQADRLRRIARSLRAPGGVLDDACAVEGSGCPPALQAAWKAFDGAAGGDRAGVAIFGNSLIAADRIVNVVRRRLQEQLGDAGRGLVLADRLGVAGPRDRTAAGASGWLPATIADVEPKPEARDIPPGLSGVVHVSTAPALSRFVLRDETRATVLGWAGPRGTALEVRTDDGGFHPVLSVEARDGTGAPILHHFTLPEGARRLELRALRAGAAVHGVVLENDRGGVVVETLAVAAADAKRFLTIDPELFGAQLDSRRPDLVVLMLGGNETKRVAWGQDDLDDLRSYLTALIHRVGPGPDRSCLVVGPIDAVVGADELNGFQKGQPGADPFAERPELQAVNAMQRHVALVEGCAFFDLYAAMGGRGALRRFHEADALHADLVHPKELGLAVLGQLIADALLQGWGTAPVVIDGRPAPRRGPPFAVSTSLDEAHVEQERRRPAQPL